MAILGPLAIPPATAQPVAPKSPGSNQTAKPVVPQSPATPADADGDHDGTQVNVKA
jgi:hypothetical protein